MAEPHEEYFASLSQEERMLIFIRDELYEGSWDEVLEDLKKRMAEKPWIFRLKDRIEEELKRVEKLRAYEEEHKVNLGDYQKGEMEEG